ncbi:hypothetical protein UlMin_030765 [Ulmus minor]
MVSKASDSAAKLRKSHGEQSSDGLGNLLQKMHHLKREIQADRTVSIRERIEENAKKLESHTSNLLSETSTRTSLSLAENGSGNLLSRRIEHPLYKVSGSAQGFGDRDHISSQDSTPSSSTKLPSVEKLPPYTTWIFLDRNQIMADDQSVVGKRRIYYDQHGSEALICSDSEEEIPESEEGKREFTKGEEQILWNVLEEHGEDEDVVKTLSNFIGATTLDIQDRYVMLQERNKGKLDSQSERGISLDKSLTAALDSFDKIFCRRCMVFDCRLHGCFNTIIYPNEKQIYWPEHEDSRKPCSDQCHLRLSIVKNLLEDSNSNAMHRLALYDAEEPSAHVVVDLTNDDDERAMPVKPNTTTSSQVAAGALNRDISVTSTNLESTGKRKVMKQTDTEEQDLGKVSDDIQGLTKKLKKSAAVDLEAGKIEDIPGQDSRHPDAGFDSNDELQLITHVSGSASCDKPERNFRNELGGMVEVIDLEPLDSIGVEVESVCSNSEWKQMEKELYMKGLEMFGRNSCLIARNLLSGLKTCVEVSRYMHEGGVLMPLKSIAGPSSFMEDNGKTDAEHTDQEMPGKSRLIRKRGKARKLKYSMKTAGHPSIWKRIADGKNQSCKQYMPCGCKSMCGKDCACLKDGTCCEKYCGCSKSCKNRFRGCHCAKSQCRSRQCPCFAAGRECDPDVCRNCWVSCGDGILEEPEPPRQGDGQCGNMRLLLRQQQRILLGKSDVAGWGAFIKNSVNKNEYLGEYTGELISHREADKRGKIYDRANSSFLFDLNDQYVLDAYRKGDKLKFANHSSNPNCYAKVMLVAGDHRVGIFAKERIEAGEELFYDYRYGPDQAPVWARRPEGSKRDDSVSQGRAKKHQSH